MFSFQVDQYIVTSKLEYMMETLVRKALERL